MKTIRFSLVTLAGALLLSFAQPRVGAEAEAIAKQIPFYPANTCVVSGEPLTANGTPIDRMHEGRLVRLCCKGCTKPFGANPAKFAAKIDEMAKAKQAATYPMKTCIVSGEPLEAMGTPIDLMVQGRLIRVCCNGCLKPVKKDPSAFFAKVDAELIKSQKAAYPLDKCVVTGAPLDNAVDHLYGARLVRLANADAVAKFTAAPAAYVKTVEAAWTSAGQGAARGAAKKTDAHAGHGHK